MKGQRLKFPPSGRVQIIGEREPQAPPAGRYFYQVPVLIQRPGCALEADTLEYSFPAPLEGIRFKQIARSIATDLKEKAPELPEPKVVPLSPFFLGFVPQEEIDRQAGPDLSTETIQ